MQTTPTVYNAMAQNIQGLSAQVLASAPLPFLVQLVIDALVLKQESFTAYDVTCILRAAFNQASRYLPHHDVQGSDGVRGVVHGRMENLMQAVNYTKNLEAMPNGEEAYVYSYAGPAQAPQTIQRKNVVVMSRPQHLLPDSVWVISGN